MLVSELGKLINDSIVIVKFRLIVVSSSADTDNLTALISCCACSCWANALRSTTDTIAFL